jgi:aquaporin Z
VAALVVYDTAVAFAAELAISFILMISVLLVTNHERLARYTPYFAGSLYAVNITFETSLCGMSMNPARTFGPAAYGGYRLILWMYFIAPTVGMLVAALLKSWVGTTSQGIVEKLGNNNRRKSP